MISSSYFPEKTKNHFHALHDYVFNYIKSLSSSWFSTTALFMKEKMKKKKKKKQPTGTLTWILRFKLFMYIFIPVYVSQISIGPRLIFEHKKKESDKVLQRSNKKTEAALWLWHSQIQVSFKHYICFLYKKILDQLA